MIPYNLKKAADLLSRENISLPQHSQDTRQDSANAEQHIVSILLNERMVKEVHSPNIGQPTNRAWYDIQIDGYYCDIKVSSLNTSDNTNAKHAIYYFLTGKNPREVSSNQNQFFKSMKEFENEDNKRDYYYIVVNKINTNDIFIVSLKHISDVSIAPNNLPFQCRWDKCREPADRTWKQAKHFLLSYWAQSIERKISLAKGGMPIYYPEFFNEK